MKFHIPEENLADLQNKINDLNNKAAKLNAPFITFEIGQGRMVETGPAGTAHKVYEVEVAGTAPVIAGWRLVAELEPNKDANIIYKFGEQDEIPHRFRDCKIECEYCNLNRRRIHSFILQNTESPDIFKQVGSSCLKDFTGHPDPLALAAQAEAVRKFIDSIKEFDPMAGGGSPSYLRTRLFLAITNAAIKKHGWVSRGAVYDGLATGPSTADRTLSAMLGDRKRDLDITEKDFARADQVIEWGKDLDKNKDENNDYLYNLSVILANEYLGIKQAGYAASAIPAYNKEMARQADAERSQHVGTVGKRQVFSGLELTGVLHRDGAYGTTHIYKFQDASSNALVWFASRLQDWSIGDILEGKATVKKHDEFRGVKQTALTRCSFSLQNPTNSVV